MIAFPFWPRLQTVSAHVLCRLRTEIRALLSPYAGRPRLTPCSQFETRLFPVSHITGTRLPEGLILRVRVRMFMFHAFFCAFPVVQGGTWRDFARLQLSPAQAYRVSFFVGHFFLSVRTLRKTVFVFCGLANKEIE